MITRVLLFLPFRKDLKKEKKKNSANEQCGRSRVGCHHLRPPLNLAPTERIASYRAHHHAKIAPTTVAAAAAAAAAESSGAPQTTKIALHTFPPISSSLVLRPGESQSHLLNCPSAIQESHLF